MALLEVKNLSFTYPRQPKDTTEPKPALSGDRLCPAEPGEPDRHRLCQARIGFRSGKYGSTDTGDPQKSGRDGMLFRHR